MEGNKGDASIFSLFFLATPTCCRPCLVYGRIRIIEKQEARSPDGHGGNPTAPLHSNRATGLGSCLGDRHAFTPPPHLLRNISTCFCEKGFSMPLHDLPCQRPPVVMA